MNASHSVPIPAEGVPGGNPDAPRSQWVRQYQHALEKGNKGRGLGSAGLLFCSAAQYTGGSTPSKLPMSRYASIAPTESPYTGRKYSPNSKACKCRRTNRSRSRKTTGRWGRPRRAIRDHSNLCDGNFGPRRVVNRRDSLQFLRVRVSPIRFRLTFAPEVTESRGNYIPALPALFALHPMN